MDWNPRQKYTTLVNRIQDLLSGGEERTVRDIYYALESRGHDYEYREVKTAVKKGRRAGYIDPGQIIDTSRSADVTVTTGYNTPREFLIEEVEGIEDRYTENAWAEQEKYVEVWLEKASLASVFSPICKRWNVRLESTRGDWSDSKVYRATNRLRKKLSEGKDVRILWFGDYNPSGMHAPVTIQETMAHYGAEFREESDSSSKMYFDCWPADYPVIFEYDDGTEGTLRFERVALNTTHIDRYDLPENPTPSGTDKDRTLKDRFMKHVSEGRDVNVELNALKEFHRGDFEEMIENAITAHADESVVEAAENRVRTAREDIRRALSIDYEQLE